jgi:hypothetical protein
MGLHRHRLPWVFTHTYGPYSTTKCPSPSRLTVLQTQLKYSTLTLVLHPRSALSAPLLPWWPCASRPSGRRLLSRAPSHPSASRSSPRAPSPLGHSSPTCSPTLARVVLHPLRRRAPCATTTVAQHHGSPPAHIYICISLITCIS